MIIRGKDIPVPHYANMLGGRKYVDGQRYLEESLSMGAIPFFGRATMPPGGSFGFHIQKCRPRGDMEIYYIIKGKALAYDDNETAELGPGDMLFCPNGMWNGMENIGDEELEFISILVYANPAHDPKLQPEQ